MTPLQGHIKFKWLRRRRRRKTCTKKKGRKGKHMSEGKYLKSFFNQRE
jgi:hypothetical protein